MALRDWRDQKELLPRMGTRSGVLRGPGQDRGELAQAGRALVPDSDRRWGILLPFLAALCQHREIHSTHL